MKHKYKLTTNELHELKKLTLIYILDGSKAKNGVYWNKYRKKYERKIEQNKD
jgi:hypothetical protein